MKKILVCLIAFVLVVPVVYGGTAYVDSIVMDATVNQDGSMTVKETIKWDIEGELNGVYRDILLKSKELDINSASDIKITEVTVDNVIYNYAKDLASNGESEKYNILKIDNGIQVKIFSPSDDEFKITTITYTLYDVATKYTDVAEVYWNFIGDGWDYGISEVELRVKVPGNPKILKVFGHGPLNGFSEIVNENEVLLKVQNVRSNEQVDARIVFDTELVESKKSFSYAALNHIISKETNLAKEANNRREMAKNLLYFSIAITIIALIVPLIIYYKAKERLLKTYFNGKYYRELPEDYGPAVMNKVLHPSLTTPSSLDMLATLLDLVRKKYVEVEPLYKNNKKKPTDYNLKLINTNLEELNEQEQYFINKLIFDGNTEITLKDLEKRNTKTVTASNKAHARYNTWANKIEKLAKDNEVINEKVKHAGKGIGKCVFCTLVTLIIAIIGMGLELTDVMVIGLLGFTISITEAIVVGTVLYETRMRTDKGNEHKAMWNAFERFLKDFSKLDEYDYKSIAIWEHYLVYATALGISKKVIKQLKIVLPTEFNEDMFSTYMTLNILSNDTAFSSFSSSFSSAASIAFSTPSSNGSGGGFSGGAGGGGGGRRRWRILVIKKERKYEFLCDAYVRFRYS